MISQCLTCPAWGKNENGVIVWYRGSMPKLVEIGREIWPTTGPSPYCPECWKKIQEKHERKE